MPRMEKESRTLSLSSAFGLGALILIIGFGVGYEVSSAKVGASSLGSVGQPAGVDLDPVWRAWEVIDKKFVPSASSSIATSTADVNQERVWGMIQGLAGSLGDPYTFFLPPAENEQFSDDLSGKFEGVGMEIANRDQILTVVAPLKGTPAERAGIRSGDKILKIDDTDTRGMGTDEAVKKIRGPKGSQVTLLVAREAWTEPREIKVTRDVINVPIVTIETKGDVFVIAVASFTSNSPDLFRAALREFVESGKQKLIIDVRGNPGGYLEAAVDMASWFLPTGSAVVTEDYAGNAENIVHRSRGYNVFNDNLEIVILIDKGSASASEILAAALHHYKKGILLGTNSFGKGSVQELVNITADTSLKVTVAHWLAPSGKQIPLEGIAPDIEVKISEEEFEAGEDPQMEAALAELAK